MIDFNERYFGQTSEINLLFKCNQSNACITILRYFSGSDSYNCHVMN